LDLKGDTKGACGQIVCAPSIHPDTGKPYQWFKGHTPWECEFAPLPLWIIGYRFGLSIAETKAILDNAALSEVEKIAARQKRQGTPHRNGQAGEFGATNSTAALFSQRSRSDHKRLESYSGG